MTRRRFLRLLSPAAALVLWQLLTSYDVNLWLRFEQFPTVTDVARAFGQRVRGEAYWQDLVDSLTRIVTGFLLAAVAGVAVGTAIARSRLAADLVGPVLEVLRPIPAIALVPVAILLFPSNEQGIVFITFTAAFFPVLVSTRHAVRALTPVWEEAVRTMGGGRRRVLFSVVLPGALPGILGGLSVGIGVSWICVVSAEMISGEYGVGYRTWQDYTVVDYPGVFVGMVTIGLLGRLTSTAVEVLGRRLTRWLPRTPAGRPAPPPHHRPAPATTPRAPATTRHTPAPAAHTPAAASAAAPAAAPAAEEHAPAPAHAPAPERAPAPPGDAPRQDRSGAVRVPVRGETPS